MLGGVVRLPDPVERAARRAPLRAAAEPLPRGEAGLLHARRPEPDLVPDAARVRRVASVGDVFGKTKMPGPGERSAVAAAGRQVHNRETKIRAWEERGNTGEEKRAAKAAKFEVKPMGPKLSLIHISEPTRPY